MLADVIDCLRCPHCGAGLAGSGGSLACVNGHSFDVARQGYANLLPGGARTGTADTAAMVEARDAFLGAGHLEPIARAVAETARRAVPAQAQGCVADVGAGTGYYLARVLDALPERRGVALDISKHAARRAARAHPRAGAVVGDTWDALPLRDGAAALVLDVFAPRNAAEFARVLAPGAALLVVTPSTRHLCELVDVLGLLHVPEDKQQRLDETLAGRFALAERAEVEYAMRLAAPEVARLADMGPSAWHADGSLGARIEALPEPVQVTASVRVSLYRRRD